MACRNNIEVENTGGTPCLSVVVPLFNESANLNDLCLELCRCLDELELSWEIILVDDGSTDDSWAGIENIHEGDKRIVGLRLTGNFGHQFALLAGLRHARGEAVISMDADFQHPPQLIKKMVDLWRQGHDVVQAQRSSEPSASIVKRITSRLFYKIFSLLSGVPLVDGLADFRLLDRRILGQILKFGESGLFLRGIVQRVGAKPVNIGYEAPARRHGRSKYSFLKMFHLAWTAISSFSVIPLRLAVVAGVLVSLMSFGELIYVLYIRLFTSAAVPGWASALAVISFLFGVLFILLGIIGEYIGRIMVEVQRRPRYILAESLGMDEKDDRG